MSACGFLARYELERGSGQAQLLCRLMPNCWADGFNPEQVVEASVAAIRDAALGPEAAAAGKPLDVLMLHWLDYEVGGR